MDIYIRYTDPDGSQIIVNDDSGLKIMFDETKGSDVIHVEVISEDNPLSMPNSIPGIDKPPSMSGTPTMAMPMPAPGFPGMEASRPGSAMSMGNNAAAGPPRPPAQPMAMSMAQPMPPNSGNSNHPGPVSQNMPGPFVAPGPAAHGVPQGAYGRMDNFSTATLPPPNPQEPLK
ncbi:hypothetical protein LPJ66_010041 [Kickxella alabastrina]|uniref:Uncharacterized protein n=1 Tax=Kickxella alabastrina TaxID=61397 RepID=A0ACC1I3S9_9FUNG|nr:hypothetical protein LPJ66_010041 [Kickxella alabastrina]